MSILFFRLFGILPEFRFFVKHFFQESREKRVFRRFWGLKRYNYSVMCVFCQMFLSRIHRIYGFIKMVSSTENYRALIEDTFC